jgi:anti-sigma regulatory factor (Ser/Thr protein kinase)
VIRHGYRNGESHEIELTLSVGEHGVDLQVVDDARPFDPTTTAAVKLDAPLAERQVGGLGIHLLRGFVREMRYERIGDRNSLWLRF